MPETQVLSSTTSSPKKDEGTQVSQKPEKELSSAEKKVRLLAKVRELRHTALSKGDFKNKEPGRAYVWVNRDVNRQQHYQAMGYQICRNPDITCPWRTPEGTYVRGDLILYEIDAETHDAIKYISAERAVEGMTAPKQRFFDEAAKHNIPAKEIDRPRG